ncbi:MAG: anti-phage defense-associated sirtuin Dsr1 [Hyphomicrobiaceae bacterium]|jgi:hypothetical protein
MQFIANGPDIPELLLDAHEEGKVVFFCGAGISYPADLPSFAKLVTRIFEITGTSPLAAEKSALDSEQYDTALDLLERRLPGQRLTLHKALQQALKPKWRRVGALDTHQALLRLGRVSDGSLRLVTTNFDELFDRAGKRFKVAFNSCLAPSLPIPKASRWNGLVYLHGKLPKRVDDAMDLNRLIITSGDFGLAYLTERWAARFVSELLANYIVCFVGYSINDPVLRYMMDALAADRRLGETTPQAYAFGAYSPGQESIETTQWTAKGVTPILYNRADNHGAMHRTLQEWAKTYIDGVSGKEAIVVKHASARPSLSTREDDFVGRMIWALTHQSGLPAMRFADLSPPPPLDWLGAFSKQDFGHRDLSRFGIPAPPPEDETLSYSLLARPAPHTHAPWMTVVTHQHRQSRWDHVMSHLARWLLRYLGDPSLLLWAVESGAVLHDAFAWDIGRALDRIDDLEHAGNTHELTALQNESPRSIPTAQMRTLWRHLLEGRVRSPRFDADFFTWSKQLKRTGLTTGMRLQLRDILAPRISISRARRGPHAELPANSSDRDQLKADVACKLVLACDHAGSALDELRSTEEWSAALPALLTEFETLLKDALDIARDVGAASPQFDDSRWNLPSIEPHWQNRGFQDWVILIELVRDAWLAVQKADGDRAAAVATHWLSVPYPTFTRLALFAASYGGIPSAEWVDHLIADDGWWLWSVDTHREVLRLFVQQGPALSQQLRTGLEIAIHKGPPRWMYRRDLSAAEWRGIVNRGKYLRLCKLMSDEAPLGAASLALLATPPAGFGGWQQVREHERNEFISWMSGTGDPDFEDQRQIDFAPTKRRELVGWLMKERPEKTSILYDDTWPETCRKHPLQAGCALADLADRGVWLKDRWRAAFYSWSEKRLPRRTWYYFAPIIDRMPNDVRSHCAAAISCWLEGAARSVHPHQRIFFSLCEHVLASRHPDNETTRYVDAAINHPVGHITQAILNYWLAGNPKDGQGLPADIRAILERVLSANGRPFLFGIVIAAAQAVSLFRADPDWTHDHLLLLFGWTHSDRAKPAWEGFLWSARLYKPLMIAIKPAFLETARHYAELDPQAARIYAQLLTYAGLDLIEGYTFPNIAEALSVFPEKGLIEVTRTLANAIGAAADKKADYWTNRIAPFWRGTWPKEIRITSAPLSEALANLAIAADDQFPAAFRMAEPLLCPIEHLHYLCRKLGKSKLPSLFPRETLQLLDAIVPKTPRHPLGDLLRVLEQIKQAQPGLERTTPFDRLMILARQAKQ